MHPKATLQKDFHGTIHHNMHDARTLRPQTLPRENQFVSTWHPLRPLRADNFQHTRESSSISYHYVYNTHLYVFPPRVLPSPLNFFYFLLLMAIPRISPTANFYPPSSRANVFVVLTAGKSSPNQSATAISYCLPRSIFDMLPSYKDSNHIS